MQGNEVICPAGLECGRWSVLLFAHHSLFSIVLWGMMGASDTVIWL